MNREQHNSSLWDKIAGNWKQLTGEIRSQWGKLTDDDMMYINGQREKLVGKIQERYGMAREEVERQIENWSNRLRSE